MAKLLIIFLSYKQNTFLVLASDINTKIWIRNNYLNGSKKFQG